MHLNMIFADICRLLTGPGTYTASYPVSTGVLSPGVKLPLEAPNSADTKKILIYTSTAS
jgi:hypothetical protein